MSKGKKIDCAGFLCLIILTVLTLNGCHLAKKTISGRKTMSDDESIVRKVVNTQPDWKFIEIRLTGKADEDNKKIGFMGTVKMEKDRQIYVVLRTSIGIELARVFADLDSVWLVSKMLGIKEKGDWKLVARKIGYPLDFFAIQGILVQSLFTSSGDQINTLIENLVVKSDMENLHLKSKTDLNSDGKEMKYFSDFLINRESFIIENAKIRDINGQWIADVKYIYNNDNFIRKIQLKGIDTERNFAVELNLVKKDVKDFLEIKFDKF